MAIVIHVYNDGQTEHVRWNYHTRHIVLQLPIVYATSRLIVQLTYRNLARGRGVVELGENAQ